MSRRDFLKTGCACMGALAAAGLVGCAGEPGASDPREDGQPDGGTSPSSAQQEAPATAQGATPPSANVAVVFFSCTGNTEAVAGRVAEAANGRLMRLEAAEPYTAQDLDYNSDCRANAEQREGSARPALAGPIPNIASCDTVYLGYPIWWGKAPRVMLAFLEGADTAGKKIVPFCTSGSSPISGSIDELRAAARDAEWGEGRRFARDASQQEVASWVEAA